MGKNNYKTIFSLILIDAIGLGCSGNSETERAKTKNANQSRTVSSNNVNLPSTPAATVINNSPATSNNPAANNNKGLKPAPAANMPTPKIGSGGDDMALFAQVRNAFSADQELFNGVIVEIKEGNASLSGKVTSEEKKKKAEQLVQAVRGIKSVKNNVRVAP